jgi:hypothetical protein
MASYLNVNTGPERVQVIPVPLGTVQVPGAATSIAAFVIQSNFPGAPTDTAVSIQSLDDYVASFGTDANGVGYWAVKGFYDNAGTGAPALIVNISPSAPSGDLITFTAASNSVRNPSTDAAVAFSGMSSASSAGAGLIIDTNYVMNDNLLQGDMLVQAGASKGTAVVSGVTANVVSGSGFLVINTQVGDIAYDGTNYFLVTEVISDDEILVDRNGLNPGPAFVTIYSSNVAIILDNIHVASSTSSFAPGEPATTSSAGQIVLDDPSMAPQAVNSLVENMLVSGDIQQQILNNVIQAGSTVEFSNSTPNTFTYTPATGLVQYSGSPDLSSILAGYVFRDGGGNDYQITAVNAGAYNLNIATLNSPPSAYVRPSSINTTAGANAGGSIRNGATVINFVNTSFNLGTSADITVFKPAVEIQVAGTYSASVGVYFIVKPLYQDSDYLGTSANGKGLHALDVIDSVDLVMIPQVEDPAIQLELINYVTNERSDCFALLAIPSYVTSSSVDQVIASINIVSITNGSESSILHLSAGANLSQVKPNMVVEIGGNLYVILSVDQADNELEVNSTSISSTGAATINMVSAVTYKNVIVNSPSTQAAWYFNWLVVDNSSGGTITIDPVGNIAGVMARIDANTLIGGPSHAPAGIQYAQLGGTVGLQLSLSENVDGYPLRSNFINRITSFPGTGNVIFGAYTAGGNSVTPDEQLIQVIRSVLFIKNSLEPGLRGFIWENQDPNTQRKVAEAITAFCIANAYLFPAGLPQSQQFQVIEVTPTQTQLNEGLLQVILQVRFNTAIRFIEIDLEYPIPLTS